MIETHRQLTKGGGVGIFLYDHLPFQIRPDIFLYDDIFESIFIDIYNAIFQRGKSTIKDHQVADLPYFYHLMPLILSGLIQEINTAILCWTII